MQTSDAHSISITSNSSTEYPWISTSPLRSPLSSPSPLSLSLSLSRSLSLSLSLPISELNETRDFLDATIRDDSLPEWHITSWHHMHQLQQPHQRQEQRSKECATGLTGATEEAVEHQKQQQQQWQQQQRRRTTNSATTTTTTTTKSNDKNNNNNNNNNINNSINIIITSHSSSNSRGNISSSSSSNRQQQQGQQSPPSRRIIRLATQASRRANPTDMLATMAARCGSDYFNPSPTSSPDAASKLLSGLSCATRSTYFQIND